MSVINQAWLEEVLHEDELGRKIIRFESVSIEATGGSGDNFASTVHRLRLELTLESDKAHSMAVVLKAAPTAEGQLAFLEDEGFMETELLSTGYSIRPRKDQLDLEHAILTVRGLAKMHAASVVLKRRGKLDVSGLKPFMHVRSTPAMRKYRTGAVQALASAIIDNWGPEWRDIGERLQNKCLFNEEVEKLAEVDETRLNVLCHGDPWTTNIFFRYFPESDGRPIAVRFIDFQLVCYNSYAFDLLFLLGTSLPTDLRRKCKIQILESYLQELKQFLESYKLQHLVPTLEMAQDELKRLDPFYFYVLVTELPMVTATIEDPLNLNKLMPGEDGSAQNPDIYRGSFKHDVDEELLHWAEENWF